MAPDPRNGLRLLILGYTGRSTTLLGAYTGLACVSGRA